MYTSCTHPVHISTDKEVITTVDAKSDSPELPRCCRVITGLATDRSGNLYVSDSSRVWIINLGAISLKIHGQTVLPGAMRRIVGSGKQDFEGDGGPAVEARLNNPTGIALDRKGSLHVADAQEHTIRKVDPAGKISTVAGTGIMGFNGDGLKGALTSLGAPSALAVDRCGNLLISDTANGRTRLLTFAPRCLSSKEGP